MNKYLEEEKTYSGQYHTNKMSSTWSPSKKMAKNYNDQGSSDHGPLTNKHQEGA